jgi:hypothetical protein
MGEGWSVRRIRVSPLALGLVLIALAFALAALWLALHRNAPAPMALPASTWPDRALTPGAVDPAVSDADICAHDWAPGDPPQHGGDMTYSKAARHTSAQTKDAVFAEYHLTNPRDGGQSFEVDHLVPLALGGRDAIENLWPESRTGDQLNAWAKDRLEYRLFRLVCDPPPGEARVPLAQAQAAFRTDWVAAYRQYCADEADCPAFSH